MKHLEITVVHWYTDWYTSTQILRQTGYIKTGLFRHNALDSGHIQCLLIIHEQLQSSVPGFQTHKCLIKDNLFCFNFLVVFFSSENLLYVFSRLNN